MTQVTAGIIGISLGAVLLISTQLICYKLFGYSENYHKAVVISLSCMLLGVLATLLLIKITT
ncbi:hypothetical protein LCGC14_2686680 [marine sediment metagenome]|uniref:Uncharacterized protein n=1 Tax=marine sediment metagenome TaxID=412755 RepID=A0A0F9A782_9ZZZZ